MKAWKMLLFIVLTLVVVSACGKDDKTVKTKEIKIPDTEEYKSLYAQGVNEEGVGTNDTRKTISDQKIIQTFIEKVNLMEVIKPKLEEDTANVKELHNQGNYIIALSKSEDVNGKTYKLYFLKDGTVFFQDPVKKEMTFMSAQKDTALYEEVKGLLDIQF
ncbi:hypothetical protein JFL43_00045 [Viridibacillus sp. YIM B01967]|uniref:Lipoprotein n=1 Tax=Viridibacillus soli TaxID=2798301 RepID=A0ABS1H1U9_9BACL|nr:hypothetical protein [Viridibacillus soli]MBK3493281.1 hypothetical protein [Viridibacillus soli]